MDATDLLVCGVLCPDIGHLVEVGVLDREIELLIERLDRGGVDAHVSAPGLFHAVAVSTVICRLPVCLERRPFFFFKQKTAYEIRKVTFTIDGKRVKKVRASASGNVYSITINPNRFKPGS